MASAAESQPPAQEKTPIAPTFENNNPIASAPEADSPPPEADSSAPEADSPIDLTSDSNPSAAASDTLEAATLPAPVTPAEPMDPTLGDEAGVITVSEDLVPEKDDTWLSNLIASAGSMSERHPLGALRAQAQVDIENLPVPNRRMEQWRFTDLRTVFASRYVSNARVDRDQIANFDLRQYAPDTAGVVLVFVDGIYDKDLSIVNDDSAKEWLAAGGYFGSAENYQGDAAVVSKILTERELGKDGEGGLFPTAAHAIATDAAILEVPDNYAVSRPVAVVFISTTGESPRRAKASAARLAVIAGKGSKLSLLESHVSLDKDNSYSLTLATAAFLIKEKAWVSHYVVDDTCLEAHVLASIHAEVGERGGYEMRSFGLGSKVGRFDVGVDLGEPGAHGLVYGTLVADKYQIADIHSRICHNSQDTTSDQLQKNVSADHGRAIFKGKIVVTEDGPGTDSSQLCRSLLLSNKAYVDAMPVLEIANDDVQCCHGATVADLEDDQIFYCQSRGISYEKAQVLLITGFAMEILGDCPFPNVRKLVNRKMISVAASVVEPQWKRTELTSI